MSTGLDLQASILSPFGAGPAAGEDLRLDTTPQSLYFSLRDARSEGRAAERAADADPSAGPGSPTHWQTVQALATEALQRRTKDIEIAVWLAESLTRRHGLPGFAQAASILAGLIERFWDDGLFPSADEADPESRLIALSGLSGSDRDGSLLQPLRRTVLFHREDGTPLRFWEYERSREVAGVGSPANGRQLPATGLPDFACIEAEAAGLGQDELRETGREVAAAAAAWAQLQTVLARIAPGNASPSTGRVAAVLDRLRIVVERHVAAGHAEQETGPEGGSPLSEAPPSGTLAEEVPGGGGNGEGRPAQAATRETLLKQVASIAQSFRRLEPNSPVGYTLEEAIRRASLPWPDLIRELVPELPQRASILCGVGLKPPAE